MREFTELELAKAMNNGMARLTNSAIAKANANPGDQQAQKDANALSDLLQESSKLIRDHEAENPS